MQIRTLSHANPLYSWCLTPVLFFKKHCFFLSLEKHDSSHVHSFKSRKLLCRSQHQIFEAGGIKAILASLKTKQILTV